MKEALALASLMIGIVTAIPYIIAIIKRRAKPQRITWFLWSLVTVNFLISAILTGGNILFTIGQLVGPLLILILSIKFGIGGKTRVDIVSLTLALVAFLLLIFFQNSVIFGLVLTLIVDGIGAFLTIKKTLQDRTSEPKLAWGLSAFGGLLGIVSLQVYSVETLVFPLYIFLLATAMFLLAKPHKIEEEK